MYFPKRKTTACSAGSTIKIPDKTHKIKIKATKPEANIFSPLTDCFGGILEEAPLKLLSLDLIKNFFNFAVSCFKASSKSGGCCDLPLRGSLSLFGSFQPMHIAPYQKIIYTVDDFMGSSHFVQPSIGFFLFSSSVDKSTILAPKSLFNDSTPSLSSDPSGT